MKNREIEKKFYILNKSFNEVITVLRTIFGLDSENSERGFETETYFEAPNGSDVDFLRVRTYENGDGLFTMKKKDQDSNENRYEFELKMSDWEALELANRLSPGIAQTFRRYFFVANLTSTTKLAAYIIEGIDKVFVEVEASSIEEVNRTLLSIPSSLEMIAESNSIFELYVQPAIYRYRSIP